MKRKKYKKNVKLLSHNNTARQRRQFGFLGGNFFLIVNGRTRLSRFNIPQNLGIQIGQLI